MWVILALVGYQSVIALIDERVARFAWPRQSDDDLGAPRVPKARVWTFEPRWAVPFVQRLAQANGFECGRDDIEATDKWFTELVKVEEFTDRARIHQWLVTADGTRRKYEWNDRFVGWNRADERDVLLDSAIWTLELEKAWPKGQCRLQMSAPWTTSARAGEQRYLRLVLWLGSRTRSNDSPTPPQVIFDVPLDRGALDEQAETGAIKDGGNSWHARKGEGAEWEWGWWLSVR